MIMKNKLVFLLLITSITFAGCMSAGKHEQNLKSVKEKEMTLGIVQRDIRIGMSQADVSEALGSPNIVTKDREGKETWVYDKIASEASYSASRGYWTLILFGSSKESAQASSTQKTLTVVIKFDEKNAVEKITYHSSKF